MTPVMLFYRFAVVILLMVSERWLEIVRLRSGSSSGRIEIGAKVSFPATGGSPCKMAESRMTRGGRR